MPSIGTASILLRMTDVFQTGTSADVPILEVRLLGGFAAAIDAVDVAAERWPSLRATHLIGQPLREY